MSRKQPPVWMDGNFIRIGREQRECIRCHKVRITGVLSLYNGYVVGMYCQGCWNKDRVLEGWEKPPRKKTF